MSWQPIETAPKDGTRILLYDESYSDKLDECIQIHEWKEYTYFDDIIFDWIMYEDDLGYCRFSDPTHWMLLPEKPIN